MFPTIVGMSIVILGLAAWCVWLTITLYDTRDAAADAIDAQTTLYMKLYNRLRALEAPAYPKYMGTPLPADEQECGTPDSVGWRGDAVSKYPSELVDPELHSFFAVTPEQSQAYDNQTADRLADLHDAVKPDSGK